MGEVASFHLQNDVATWSEQNQVSSPHISNAQKSETPIFYENGIYSIITQYNIENNARTYPGIIFVRISPKDGYTGENRSSKELIIYSSSYEQRLRSALILAAQEEILLQKYQKIGVVPTTPIPTPVIPNPTPVVTPTPIVTPPVVTPTPIVTPTPTPTPVTPVTPITPKPTHTQNSQEITYPQTTYK